MKWIGERISFLEDKEKATFVIYPSATSLVKALMGAWFAMWIVIGVSTILYSLKFDLTDQENIIVIVFLVFWAYYAYKVGKSYFWLMWGKELIKVNETSVVYKRSIKKYGKANIYYLENIKKMRMHQPKENSLQSIWEGSPWVTGGERIEFDYMGKIIRLGRKLNEKDGKLFFTVLTKKIEEKLRKVKN